MSGLKVIISGGGTGGHIFPAIAIANEIRKQRPDSVFLFVGAKGRMEMEKVPKAGYVIEGLWISGLQRKISLSLLQFPLKVISSLIKARKLINQFKPDVVIGTGGYASGPTLKAAASKGIPCLIQEQNSYPGITNKLLASKVKLICVAYEGMDKFFPKDKLLLTGNPVRQDITEISDKKPEALSYFKLSENKPIILVIGGSLGARTINLAIANNIKEIVNSGLQIIWQTGKAYFETAKASAIDFHDSVKVFDFISSMNLAYAAASMIVSRSGASSVSEIAIVAKPCILIPSPNVAEDHQTKNAMALVNKDAALIIKDNEAEFKLKDSLIELAFNPILCQKLSTNIKALAMPRASETIANEAIKLALKNKT